MAPIIHRAVENLRARSFSALLGVSLCALMAAAYPAQARQMQKQPKAQTDLSSPQWKQKPVGEVIFVVSIADQRLTIYDDGVPVARTTVSTGVTGHLTPRGIFSILQKDRHHKSNLYSEAPMPYMQRITWSGVAMHEGHVTGRQASHGCVRLPQAFAARLWPYTKNGMRVIISDSDLTPVEFAHQNLFAATKRDTSAQLPQLQHVAQSASGLVSDATQVDVPDSAHGGIVPLADLPGELTRELQAAAPVETGKTAASAPETAATPAAPAESTTAAEMPTPAPITVAAGSGHIAMFISKKEGKLFVRRNFAPLFETPVLIRDPAKPLGSHLFTAMSVSEDKTNVNWSVVDVPDAPLPPAPPRRRKGEPAAEPAILPAPSSSAEALDRIIIPEVARIAIAGLIQPGLSLIVSDQGFGRETGKGTDFIVLTR